jgi:hypothetical protein
VLFRLLRSRRPHSSDAPYLTPPPLRIPTFGILRWCEKKKRERARREAGWTTVSKPLGGYGLLTEASHYGRYCEPALRRALRTCTTTLLVLSVFASGHCSFAAAGDAPRRRYGINALWINLLCPLASYVDLEPESTANFSSWRGTRQCGARPH